jgi:hypothetical protein
MSEFIDIALSISEAERELANFRNLLDSKQELSERTDILNMLPNWRHMLCGLGPLDPALGQPNRIAWELDLGGFFGCDLVVGHSTRLHYLYVEFESGAPGSIFQNARNRRAKKLGSSFNSGLGQILEWFWLNDRLTDPDYVTQRFGGRYSASAGLLVLGRDAYLDAHPLDRNRWDWIKAKFRTEPVIFFMTYDEMYEQLAQQIASWREDIDAATP